MADDGFTVLDMGQELGMAKKANPVEVVHVSVDKIVPNPYQPRKTFEEEGLLDLAASIRQYGVLQPLLVAPYEDGNYLLIAGERRLRASQMAGLKELPVIVSEYGGIAFSTDDKDAWGYGNMVKTEKEFMTRFEKITSAIKKIPYICGYCYTQVSDVEQEVNGLLDENHAYKINAEKISRINLEQIGIHKMK